jgi:hypothetical protein
VLTCPISYQRPPDTPKKSYESGKRHQSSHPLPIHHKTTSHDGPLSGRLLPLRSVPYLVRLFLVYIRFRLVISSPRITRSEDSTNLNLIHTRNRRGNPTNMKRRTRKENVLEEWDEFACESKDVTNGERTKYILIKLNHTPNWRRGTSAEHGSKRTGATMKGERGKYERSASTIPAFCL